MKKIITFLLSLSLLVCMGTTVFAEDKESNASETANEVSGAIVNPAESENRESTENPGSAVTFEMPPEETGNSDSHTSIDVDAPATVIGSKDDSTEETGKTAESEGSSSSQGNIAADEPQPVADGPAIIDDSYQVKISWFGMSFTYCEEQSTWDADKMEQTTTPAHWESTGGNGYGTFTVENKSSDTIDVTFSFSKDEALNQAGTLKMRFSTISGEDAKTSSDNLDSIKVSVASQQTGYVYVVPAIGTSFNQETLKSGSVKLGTIKFVVETEGLTDPSSPDLPEIFD